VEVSFCNGRDFTDAMIGLHDVITRTDRDWQRFVRVLRRSHGHPPLCIDGREYHRRQRRRTKRKQKR
jgi:hypothetical protein